jgi:hypothetical protein
LKRAGQISSKAPASTAENALILKCF